ncbi:hypothetical protein [Bacillus cereus group sp. TH260-2LC]|uniref:hypothetical protein n=1 Tax=unclassified Bacillus cereus group TaxID=2750818 RepID=UPI0022E758D5|nr:hypothetical protein [Bacillus cereus group sp. TH260-2LC]MDA1527236.1 hypothetical protein [Bacillus cereus group sp. TH260-2LC]
MQNNKKQCAYCRKMKERTEFHEMQASPDGLQYRCKPCNNQTKNTNTRILIVPIETDGETIDHRYCKACEELKPLDNFTENGRGGKRALCKTCIRSKSRRSRAMKKALIEANTTKS